MSSLNWQLPVLSSISRSHSLGSFRIIRAKSNYTYATRESEFEPSQLSSPILCEVVVDPNFVILKTFSNVMKIMHCRIEITNIKSWIQFTYPILA